ncbi:asparagine synthase C-terminal domain-containing protein [Halobaculum gomorrense]|uniref:Asparagine synthase (Glutamine-hydrolysing) n=1 Tax=Halobaculum gomorrense TaxID=43928 RepID=A0A1M5PAS5_9EURY|nr:asparagine synthase-related protein [Halobaculum gomorrense]SHG98870.1 asparagine synthase (glutamine-hydrolysing) [Halobaculum gomorrense]
MPRRPTGTDLDGDAGAALIRGALADGDPLPGTDGFAGVVDGTLVRDVLGRWPLFVDADTDAPDCWSRSLDRLEDPRPLPAGFAADNQGQRRVWSLPDPEPTADASALAAVADAVETSVRAVDPDGLAVAFSGGVDSAVVAAGVPETPLYVAGFEGAHDVAAARDAAAAMDRELREVTLSHADLERAVPELVAATGRRNPMDVAIALPLYLVGERAAADGHHRLAIGQGADELFGGYAKVVDPADDPRVDADTVRGARRETVATLPDQLERDVLALRAAGVEPVAPLLHDRVVRAALALPGHLLVADGERKVALRAAAADMVPQHVRSAEKKAVQYGTYVSRELDRLARQAGFKRRMDDHVGRYLADLCGETHSPNDGS